MNQENKSDPKRNKSPREIEADIGETRKAITDDIKALGDKVSPANLKQEAKNALGDAKDAAAEKISQVADKAAEVKDVAMDKAAEMKDVALQKAEQLKDATVEKTQQVAEAASETFQEVSEQTRRAGRRAWRFTTDNAVPLTLIGVGAGLLIANQRRESAWRRPEYPAFELEDDMDYPSDNAAFYTDQPHAPRRRRLASRAPASATGTSSGNGGANLAQRAGQRLDRAEHQLAERAAQGRDAVQNTLSRARRASVDFAEANPWAVFLGTLAAGIGVGLLLPSTAREDQLLGPSREKLRGVMNDARGTMRQVGRVAKQTAQDTVATATGHVH